MSRLRTLWLDTSFRLLTAALVTAIAVLGGASVVEVLQEHRNAELAFEETTQLTLERLRSDLEYPLWHLEHAAVERVVRHELASAEVIAVIIREEHGEVYVGLLREPDGEVNAFRPSDPADAARLAAASRVATGTIVEGMDAIGSVSLYLTDQRLRAAQREGLVQAVVRLLLLVPVLAMVLFAAVRVLIVRPIQRLEAWVMAVEVGAAVPPTPLASPSSEVASLTRAFGAMAARQLASQEQLRALASRLQRVREDEKTRIARDLHDELGQLLTGLKMDLAWLESRIEALPSGKETNAMLERVVAAAELSDRTVERVQQISTDLRPATLDRLGLGAALQQEARRFQERSAVPCQAAVPDALPPHSGDAATALYRIAQEALTNVARHARASSAALRLRAVDGALELCVEDDGDGIAAGEAARPTSLGLLGMMERASLLGGGVSFARRAPRGTVVTARVPLRGPDGPKEEAR